MSMWVVETGNPRRVASKLAMAAPIPTASRKSGRPTSSFGTSPLPEKVSISVPGMNKAARQPAAVVTAAQRTAVQ